MVEGRFQQRPYRVDLSERSHGRIANGAASLVQRESCEHPALGLVDAFMVVVLGGVGNLAGTIAGALMIGLTNPLFEYITTSSMGRVIVFTLVIVFLQWKPSGLFSLKTRALD